MQKREKILLVGVLGLLGVIGLRYCYNWVTDLFDQRDQQIASLESEIRRKELLVLKGQKARERLTKYEARSLPSNRDLARSLYQNWLISLIDQAGLAGGNVTSQAPQKQRDAFDRLTFNVSGQGDLAQVVKLLHDFYAAGYLQQIRLLSLKPLEEGQHFEMLLAVEAIALPGALERDKLPKVKPPEGLGELASYEKQIVKRNVFAPYQEPKRIETVKEEEPPPFDVAKFTTVSAILSNNGRPEVWLNNRTTGEVLRLGEGAEFELGSLRGTIQKIGVRDVEVQTKDGRKVLALGENLRQGKTVAEADKL